MCVSASTLIITSDVTVVFSEALFRSYTSIFHYLRHYLITSASALHTNYDDNVTAVRSLWGPHSANQQKTLAHPGPLIPRLAVDGHMTYLFPLTYCRGVLMLLVSARYFMSGSLGA